jgi:hypothetical protein
MSTSSDTQAVNKYVQNVNWFEIKLLTCRLILGVGSETRREVYTRTNNMLFQLLYLFAGEKSVERYAVDTL